jgi:hypothetical protein
VAYPGEAMPPPKNIKEKEKKKTLGGCFSGFLYLPPLCLVTFNCRHYFGPSNLESLALLLVNEIYSFNIIAIMELMGVSQYSERFRCSLK